MLHAPCRRDGVDQEQSPAARARFKPAQFGFERRAWIRDLDADVPVRDDPQDDFL
jgi:hypothetical protein